MPLRPWQISQETGSRSTSPGSRPAWGTSNLPAHPYPEVMQQQTFGKLFLTGGVAGVLGGAVSFIVWWIATLIGMSDQVNVMGQGMQTLQWYQFIVFGMFSGFGGGAVAGLLRTRANGAQVFTIISVIVLVLSFATPLLNQADTEWLTKIVLLATHVIVFLAVVPTLRRRMS